MEHTDNETGELLPNVHYTVDELNAFDLETGETDTNTPTILQRKTRFTIPKELIKPSADEDSKKCCCIDPNETFTLCKKEEVINLQEVSIVPSCIIRDFFLKENVAKNSRKSSSATTRLLIDFFSYRVSSYSHAYAHR